MLEREAKAAIGFYGSTPVYAFQFDDLGYEGKRQALAEKLRAGDRDGMIDHSQSGAASLGEVSSPPRIEASAPARSTTSVTCALVSTSVEASTSD